MKRSISDASLFYESLSVVIFIPQTLTWEVERCVMHKLTVKVVMLLKRKYLGLEALDSFAIPYTVVILNHNAMTCTNNMTLLQIKVKKAIICDNILK